MNYMTQALFIYDDESEVPIETITNNHFNTQITSVEKSEFLQDPIEYLDISCHLILSGSMQLMRQLLEFASAQNANGQQCSLAFLLGSSQQALRRAYQLSNDINENIEVALRDDVQAINLLECNQSIVQFKAVIGQIPLLEAWHADASMKSLLGNLLLGVKQFFSLSLNKISIETERGKEIKSVASGIFVVNQNQGSHLSRVLKQQSSMRSDKMSMMILSPFSAVEYFLFLFSLIFKLKKYKTLPHAVSNIQSSEITLNIEASSHKEVEVQIDDLYKTTFPLNFKVLNNAIKINAPEKFWMLNPVSAVEKEVIRVDNLPDEKEARKYIYQHLPFFSVASTDRFKELFLQLRDDARINSLYIVLILLSTLLASLGLFADSSAVVIGAMLLAPLMSPIIANAMGILRGDEKLLYESMKKIALGIGLALIASCVLTLILPQMGLSNEIKARINPNLIDLGIAVFSGIAAAYTKSHRELLNSLAGVAIAVALVPPLATAGIGLGRGEYFVLEGALLLFITNLIGIIVAATITFQFLGFSNTVKSKKSLWIILSILLLLSYPLYRSYTDTLQRFTLTSNLLNENIVLHEKTVLIETASIEYQNNIKIINIVIVLKEALNNEELKELKKKIDQRFPSKYQIRMTMKFIL